MSKSSQAETMVPQARIVETEKRWHRNVLRDLEAKLADSGFPCVFARNAFRKSLLRLVFVESAGPGGMELLAAGLTQYVELSKKWDGRLDTAYPLVVAFSPDVVDARSVDEYHAFGWKILQRLHESDPAPWPEGVSSDPDSHSWSMCFNGMPLFCNMSSPAHRVRRSRNLGDHFMLVINPRERFDVFAGDTPSGRNTRSTIRHRIARYDGAPPSLQLGTYGAGGAEWWQYGLVEENVQREDKCPFKHHARS